MTIFLTRSRRTQKRFLTILLPSGDNLFRRARFIANHRSVLARGVQATDEARELGEPLALGEVLVLVSCRTPREL